MDFQKADERIPYIYKKFSFYVFIHYLSLQVVNPLHHKPNRFWKNSFCKSNALYLDKLWIHSLPSFVCTHQLISKQDGAM